MKKKLLVLVLLVVFLFNLQTVEAFFTDSKSVNINIAPVEFSDVVDVVTNEGDYISDKKSHIIPKKDPVSITLTNSLAVAIEIETVKIQLPDNITPTNVVGDTFRLEPGKKGTFTITELDGQLMAGSLYSGSVTINLTLSPTFVLTGEVPVSFLYEGQK